MIDLVLDIDGVKKNYKVPENWNEVNMRTFELIANVNSQDENDFFGSMKVFAALTGMSMDDVMLLPVDELPEVLKLVSFANTTIEEKEVDSIVIDGEEYFIKKDMDKLTTGEVLSLDHLAKKYENNIQAGMSEMLCVFLRRKIDGKLESFKSEFMERAELFRDKVMVSDVYHLFLFFSSGKSK